MMARSALELKPDPVLVWLLFVGHEASASAGIVFIMCALSSLAAMLVYLFMYLRLKKTIPALADAS